jgi:phosphate ABC transporter permease protein PstC
MNPSSPRIGRIRYLSDAVVRGCCLLALCLGISFLLLMIGFMWRESSLGIGFGINLYHFLVKEPWAPLATPPSYGIAHAVISTLLVAGLSLVLAVPLGFGIGLFTAEIAPLPVQQIMQPALEVLAGIPSVVYGFFGYVTLVKSFEGWFDMPTGECLLIAGIILAVMILPFIASTAAETFRSIPGELKDAAFSLGVTHLYASRRIFWRAALPGLFAAVALGMARALGETLAVLMLAGNSVAVPHSLFDRGQPLTALLATELGETAVYSVKYQALFASGFFLLVIVLGINILIWIMKQKVMQHAHA